MIWIGIGLLFIILTVYVKKGPRNHILIREFSSENETFLKRGNLIQ